jgi:WD40 repeat protein
VLIDDSIKAVLCDFGLSRVKADVTSRTTRSDGGSAEGSRNWMAPERLLGGSLKKPCDIYAFGITLHEVSSSGYVGSKAGCLNKLKQIFSNEIPWGELNFSQFVELVVRQDIRPERPDDEDAPQLSDALWELAEKCWVKNPKLRPTSSVVCDTLSHLLGTTAIAHSIPNSNDSRQTVISNTLSHSIETAATAQSIPTSNDSCQTIVADTLSHVLETTGITQSIPNSNTSHTTIVSDSTSLSHSANKAVPRQLLNPQQKLTITHLDVVQCVAFSPNGKYIVSGSGDHSVTVWDARSGTCVRGPLTGHNSAVLCVAFSNDGRLIASGSRDNTILVWDPVTGRKAAGPCKGHTSYVMAVCFSPNGQQIASGSTDRTIRMWDAQTGLPLVGPLTVHTDSINSVVFSADGGRLASGSADKTVCVWELKSSGLTLGPLKQDENRVYFVAFSLDGNWIVSESRAGDVCVWNAGTGALISGPSKQHSDGALALLFTANSSDLCAISPDGKWIAAVETEDTLVRIWHSKTGRLVKTIDAHTNYVQSITFSPDSKHIATASFDKTVLIHGLNLQP